MKAVLLVSSLASLAVLAAAAFQENFRGDWRAAQQTYRQALERNASDAASRTSAKAAAAAPQQIYLPELGIIDRCTTCHLGVENPTMANEGQPLRAHSGELLGQHPVDKFGCTVCHQGQGRAVGREAAHGWQADGSTMPHVDTPMLRDQAVYTSCGRCHHENDLFGGEADVFAGAGEKARPSLDQASLTRSLAGSKRLARGKRLVVESGCLGCHQYRGRGGALGTDLTYVGDKTRHDFDFKHVKGEHTVEQWLFEHFKVPREVSPGTVMPDMGLSDDQARDLALYMMSLHRKSAPASHLPRPHVASTGSTNAEDRGAGPGVVRGETLYSMFCSSCHGADGYGTTMRTGLWPGDADPWGHEWDARSVVVERRGEMDVVVPSLHHPGTLAVASDDYLRTIISKGRPGTKMLAWGEQGGLSSDEITLLVNFIRGWDRPVPELASVTSDAGDARVGAALYRANCAACHGTDGEGGIGNSLNSATFLAAASDAFLRDTMVHGRPNTAMPAWKEFDVRELSDLLAFIRQWQTTRGDEAGAVALSGEDGNAGVSAEVGRTLFNANCVTCHGDSGVGDLGPTLNTQAFLTAVPDEYLAATMLRGRPGTGMPSWRHLSNEDVASIVQYVRTWQREPAKTTEWRAQAVPKGDWDAGRSLFAGNCAACHGTDGEGATGPQLNNPVFLELVTDAMLREWVSFGKEGTPMRSFRKGGQGVTELSERQVEDLVAYLRLLQRAGEGELIRVAKSPHGRPEKGAALYANNCVGCHGSLGEGASGPAIGNPGFLRFASDGFLMATMALGRSGTEMRPVKHGPQSILELSSDEVNDLVAHLRSWEHNPPQGKVEPARIAHRFVIPWDLARGRRLFASNCAGCHGTEGKGAWAPELNNDGFLSAATDGFLQATIVRGRAGTAMRAFGQGAHGLTDMGPQDIDDLVAYIRSWAKAVPSPLTLPAERSLRFDADRQAGSDRRNDSTESSRSETPAEGSVAAATTPRTEKNHE